MEQWPVSQNQHLDHPSSQVTSIVSSGAWFLKVTLELVTQAKKMCTVRWRWTHGRRELEGDRTCRLPKDRRPSWRRAGTAIPWMKWTRRDVTKPPKDPLPRRRRSPKRHHTCAGQKTCTTYSPIPTAWSCLKSTSIKRIVLIYSRYDNLSFPSIGVASLRRFFSLQFWFACEGLKRQWNENPEKAIQIIILIHKKYIRSKRLIVAESIRKDVNHRVANRDTLDAHIFDQAQTEVENLIRDSVYVNFLNSDVYLSYIQVTSAALSALVYTFWYRALVAVDAKRTSGFTAKWQKWSVGKWRPSETNAVGSRCAHNEHHGRARPQRIAHAARRLWIQPGARQTGASHPQGPHGNERWTPQRRYPANVRTLLRVRPFFFLPFFLHATWIEEHAFDCLILHWFECRFHSFFVFFHHFYVGVLVLGLE